MPNDVSMHFLQGREVFNQIKGIIEGKRRGRWPREGEGCSPRRQGQGEAVVLHTRGASPRVYLSDRLTLGLHFAFSTTLCC